MLFQTQFVTLAVGARQIQRTVTNANKRLIINMKNLLIKELRLATSPLSFIFIAFALMTLIPGYPILMGTFFVCLGIFQSYQLAREQNDILYSVLLPIRKRDVVSAKYISALFIELCAFLIMAVLTVLRMTVLSAVPTYVNNAMMPATPVYLGFVLLIFGEFNSIFICGFFKTAYYFAKPFVIFIIVSMLITGIGETLHHIPFIPYSDTGFQFKCLACGAVIFSLLTYISWRRSQVLFEKIDI